MNRIKIGDRFIGEGESTFIIAEIGLNHNGQLSLAKKLIDIAVESKVDAVKFQKRDLSSLYKHDILENPLLGEQSLQYILPILKKFELTNEEFIEINEYCKSKGIIFLCSAWDKKSVDFLESLEIPLYKMASPDLTNFDLLEYIASKKKPIILSTGMSSLSEIENTINFLNEKKCQLVLLHCNSTYPASFYDINLKFMNTLLNKFNLPVGYSGHERGIAISTAAVVMGACVIERHLTLDRTMVGPDHAASLEPRGFIKLVRDIRNLEKSLGSGTKWFSRGEIINKETLGKSLVSATDIPEGVSIQREMITAKGPGKGVSPQRLFDLIGKKSIRDIKKDTYFLEQDFGEDYTKISNFSFPKKWGIIVRYNDIDNLNRFDPKIIEFHLSDKDIGFDISKLKQYPQEVVVHSPEYNGDHLLDFCSLDKATREMSVSFAQKVIDVAVELKNKFNGTPRLGPKLIFHPGGMDCDDELKDKNSLYKNLENSLKQLNSKGVEILIENMPPLPWYFGGEWHHSVFMDPYEIRDFCKKTGYNIVLDLSHAKLYCNYKKMDLVEYCNILKPFTRHIHLADAGGLNGEGLQIGEGEIDFKRLLPFLKDLDVCWIPEIWQGHKFSGEGFFTALNKINDYL
jgi:N-acetylneuraminate synthase